MTACLPSTPRARLWLLGLVALALALRVAGLDWGLPSNRQMFSFHPDEVDLVHRAEMMTVRDDWNPHFFNYGSLTMYLLALMGSRLQLAGAFEWHLAGRLLTAVFGAGTVLLLFLLTKSLRAFGAKDADEGVDRCALLAAGFLALLPGHIAHSHYATVDVPATFFVVAAALCAARTLHSNRLGILAWSGACAGLAAATKYNMALALVFLPAARAILSRAVALPARAVPARWYLAAPFLLFPPVIAFLAGCPFSVLDFKAFARDFMYELQHVRTGSGLIFEGVGPGWWNHLNTNLPFAMTMPLLVGAIAGLAIGAKRKESWCFFVSAFIVPYAIVIGAAKVSFLRYTIPLLPFLCLAAAFALQEVARRQRLRVLIAAIVMIEALAAIQAVTPFVVTDPRIAAADWWRSRSQAQERVGLLTPLWFYSPPLSQLNGGNRTAPAQNAVSRFILCRNWDAARLEREQPEWFVLSEFETRDEMRLQHEKTTAFMETLQHYYGAPARAFHGRGFALPGRKLWTPHDWLYPSPRIAIYRRLDRGAPASR